MGKRSRAATKGLRPSKTITGKQRKARKLNIKVARAAKKKMSSQQLEKKQRSFYGKLAKYEKKAGSFTANSNWHRSAVKKARSALYDPNVSSAQAMKIVKAM